MRVNRKDFSIFENKQKIEFNHLYARTNLAGKAMVEVFAGKYNLKP